MILMDKKIQKNKKIFKTSFLRPGFKTRVLRPGFKTRVLRPGFMPWIYAILYYSTMQKNLISTLGIKKGYNFLQNKA
jgi:hypothetical protein